MTHLQYIISFRSLCVALLLVSGIAKARAAEGSYIANTSVYDTERGFVHPGGLHTDADFERIRQQLADGNPRVVEAYNILKNAGYAQSSTSTAPMETVVRGGGVGENYINAARGATIAYQNALLIGTCQWPDGSDGSTYSIDGITASGEYLFSYLHAYTTYTYRLFVDEGKGTYRAPAAGRYLLRHRYTDTYLTAAGKDGAAHLSPLVTDGDKVAMHAGQVWLLEGRSQRYNFIGLPDSLYLNKEGLMKDITMRPFRFRGAKGTDYLSIQNTGTSGNICWVVDAGGTINFAGSAEPKDYPFELIPYEEGMGMTPILPAELAETRYYSLSGARIDEPASGIFIRCRIWTDGTVVTDRILMK